MHLAVLTTIESLVGVVAQNFALLLLELAGGVGVVCVAALGDAASTQA